MSSRTGSTFRIYRAPSLPKNGTPFGKITQAVKLPKYENWAMYKEWLPMNTLRVALDMYMGPFPWRPARDFEK